MNYLIIDINVKSFEFNGDGTWRELAEKKISVLKNVTVGTSHNDLCHAFRKKPEAFDSMLYQLKKGQLCVQSTNIPLQHGATYYVLFDLNEETVTTESSKRKEDNNVNPVPRKMQKTDWRTITPAENWPPRLPATYELNRFYDIPHLDIAGLVRPPLHSKRLLIRQEAFNLLNSLSQWKNFKPPEDGSEPNCPGVIIEGARGSGKSCTTWAWALSQIVNQDQSVLWVHVDDRACVARLITRESIKSKEYKLMKTAEFEQVMELLNSSTESIIVLDGLLGCEDKHRQLSEILEMNESGFHIQVTSLAFVYNSSSLLVQKYMNGIQFFEMFPWSYTDYQHACNDPEFFKSVMPFLTDNHTQSNKIVDREELLSKKFLFAGVSARYMFAINTKNLVNSINSMLNYVNDLAEDINRAKVSNTAVSGLMVKYNRDTWQLFFVSEYVAVSLAQKCPKYYFQTLYATANMLTNFSLPPGSSFRQWVFEMDVIQSCEKCTLKFYGQIFPEFYIKELVTVSTDQDTISSFSPPISNPDQLVGKFMKPYSWNNTGFYLSKLVKLEDGSFSFRFYQVTVNKNHEFNLEHYLQHVARFTRHFPGLNVSTITIVMVVPPELKNSARPFLGIPGKVSFPSDLARFKHEGTKTYWSNYQSERQIFINVFQPSI